MRPRWIGVFALVSMLGCTIWRPIDDGALVRSKPRSLLIVYLPNEQFIGPNRTLLGGMAGAIAMGALGHRIYVDHHLIDPARRISETVGVRFARHHGLKVSLLIEKRPPPPTRFQVVPAPRPGRPAADLMLEVETGDWRLSAPLLGTASVHYRVRAKLIDTRTGKVIADGHCTNAHRQQAQLATETSYDDVFIDDAAFLKRELAIAESYCTGSIAELLDVPPPRLAPPTRPAPPAPSAQPADAGVPDGAAPDATSD